MKSKFMVYKHFGIIFYIMLKYFNQKSRYTPYDVRGLYIAFLGINSFIPCYTPMYNELKYISLPSDMHFKASGETLLSISTIGETAFRAGICKDILPFLAFFNVRVHPASACGTFLVKKRSILRKLSP